MKAYICLTMQPFLQAAVPSRGNSRDRAKLKLGPTEIFHHRLPIFYKTRFDKAQ